MSKASVVFVLCKANRFPRLLSMPAKRPASPISSASCQALVEGPREASSAIRLGRDRSCPSLPKTAARCVRSPVCSASVWAVVNACNARLILAESLIRVRQVNECVTAFAEAVSCARRHWAALSQLRAASSKDPCWKNSMPCVICVSGDISVVTREGAANPGGAYAAGTR